MLVQWSSGLVICWGDARGRYGTPPLPAGSLRWGDLIKSCWGGGGVLIHWFSGLAIWWFGFPSARRTPPPLVAGVHRRGRPGRLPAAAHREAGGGVRCGPVRLRNTVCHSFDISFHLCFLHFRPTAEHSLAYISVFFSKPLAFIWRVVTFCFPRHKPPVKCLNPFHFIFLTIAFLSTPAYFLWFVIVYPVSALYFPRI